MAATSTDDQMQLNAMGKEELKLTTPLLEGATLLAMSLRLCCERLSSPKLHNNVPTI